MLRILFHLFLLNLLPGLNAYAHERIEEKAPADTTSLKFYQRKLEAKLNLQDLRTPPNRPRLQRG